MYLSKVQYKALKYICRHAYVTYQQLSELKRFRNNPHLEDTVSFLYSKELIGYFVASSRTPKKYESVNYLAHPYHLSATELGYSVVDDRIRGTKYFWVPYAIASLIAVTAAIADLIAALK